MEGDQRRLSGLLTPDWSLEAGWGSKAEARKSNIMRLMGVRKTNVPGVQALTMATGPEHGRLASLVSLRMVGSRLVTRGLGERLSL